MEKSVLSYESDLTPGIAKFFGMFQDNRRRLMHMLEDVTDEMIDYTPKDGTFETIGTLLHHIAAIEWDWIFGDIDGQQMDWDTWKYAFANRYEEVDQQKNKGKQYYLDILQKVRTDVQNRFRRFTDEDLKREIESGTESGRIYSIEWIFFHLINHEALHLGQISVLKRLYKTQNN